MPEAGRKVAIVVYRALFLVFITLPELSKLSEFSALPELSTLPINRQYYLLLSEEQFSPLYDHFSSSSTPGDTGLLCLREGRRPAIEQGCRSYRVQPEGIRIQNCREVRAFEKVNGIKLCHPAQRA